MRDNLYYQAPADSLFEEMKTQAKALWNSYDNRFGYATEKIGRIDDLENISDNYMYIFAMFDRSNQRLLANVLSTEAKAALLERLIAGGANETDYSFLKTN
jgi:hypothetical protein